MCTNVKCVPMLLLINQLESIQVAICKQYHELSYFCIHTVIHAQ